MTTGVAAIRRLVVAALVLGGLALAGVVALLALCVLSDPAHAPGEPARVGVGQVSEEHWSQLREMGWRGQPGDGCECLYAPGVRP